MKHNILFFYCLLFTSKFIISQPSIEIETTQKPAPEVPPEVPPVQNQPIYYPNQPVYQPVYDPNYQPLPPPPGYSQLPPPGYSYPSYAQQPYRPDLQQPQVQPIQPQPVPAQPLPPQPDPVMVQPQPVKPPPPPPPRKSPSNIPEVSITTKTLESAIVDIKWIGNKGTVVFIRTKNGKLYRSTDSGRSIYQQEEKLKGADGDGSVVIRNIHISPYDPKYIFLIGSGKNNWVTDNWGETYTKVSSINIQDLRMHHTKPKWLIATTISKGCRPEEGSDEIENNVNLDFDIVAGSRIHNQNQNKNSESDYCYRMLILSKDFGKTFIEIDRYIIQFDWGHEKIHGDTWIFATTNSHKNGDQKFGVWDKNVNFVLTTNFFKTQPLVLVEHGNRFHFSQQGLLFVATVDEIQETQVSLFINTDNCTRPPCIFHQAILPQAETLTEHSYTIIDLSEDTAFLHVNHKGKDALIGNIYTSDAKVKSFSLSLPNNIRTSGGQCDFEKINGLEGIYLANFVEETKDELEKEEFIDDSFNFDTNTEPLLKTVITFDKGGIWQYLKPPLKDTMGEPYSCQGNNCHLHLHGTTSSFGSMYSSDKAHGLIIATGIVGDGIYQSYSDVNTFLSRDAGLTWKEISKGSYVYEIGDHGAIIIMGHDNVADDRIYYSWDQGLTWKSHSISTQLMHIHNIVTEPTNTAQTFLVYGVNSDGQGELIYIDFRSVHERTCTGHDKPDTPGSDYETWTPNDGRLHQSDRKCLLGHSISYTRRKRDRACFNKEEHEASIFKENCVCTPEDFECDYGYERELDSSVCVPVDRKAVLAGEKMPPNCDKFYTISQGYRRIAGDTCFGGLEWDPIMNHCNSTSWLGKIVLGMLAFSLIGMCYISGFKYQPFTILGDFFSFCQNKFRYRSHRYQAIQAEPPENFDDEESYGQPTESRDSQSAYMTDGVDNSFNPREL